MNKVLLEIMAIVSGEATNRMMSNSGSVAGEGTSLHCERGKDNAHRMAMSVVGPEDRLMHIQKELPSGWPESVDQFSAVVQLRFSHVEYLWRV